MEIFKYKKQIFLDIALVIFICILIAGIILVYNRTVLTSTDATKDDNTEIIIPNVTEENTTFKISDIKNKVESVNISVTNRLNEYNLCYYIDFNTENPSEINNTDYSLLNDTILMIDENCTVYFKYELNGNYSSEVYEIKISNIEIPEITTEKVSEKELEKEKVNKKDIEKESTSPYYIKVNCEANVVTIYTKDKDGKYTVPYKAMVCSCGKYTPKSGTYKTTNKYTWRPLIHNVYGQYATRIVGSILFHSVPYSSNKKDSLLYEEYDKLGTKASEGCVRLTVKDTKWIYDNCPRGTMVEFYSDSNPGPLGKPTAQKISSVEECRNWDPTDPAAENPWHTYKAEEEKPSEDVSNNVTNDITNNVVNENINNSVVDNNVVDNSSSSNNVITDTNSAVNNNTVDNNIDNNTVNNSTTDIDSTIGNNVTNNPDSSNNTTNDNSNTNNNTTDGSNNLDNTNSGDNSAADENINNSTNGSADTNTDNSSNGSSNNDSVQNTDDINNEINNLLVNNII